MTPPIYYTWTDEGSMKPLPRFAKLCDKEFCVGETYCLVPHEDRSARSHNHYFAHLAEAHSNLPESQAERFPNVESLRKFALIKSGFSDNRSVVCASHAEAMRIAAFVRPMDEYAVVTVNNAVVNVFTAQSQSRRAMGNADFQRSKQLVLNYAWSLCGVDRETASKHVGQAA